MWVMQLVTVNNFGKYSYWLFVATNVASCTVCSAVGVCCWYYRVCELWGLGLQ